MQVYNEVHLFLDLKWNFKWDTLLLHHRHTLHPEYQTLTTKRSPPLSQNSHLSCNTNLSSQVHFNVTTDAW